VKEVIRRIGTR